MINLNPKILEKDGKKEFAILTYEEFERLTEQLEDYEDLKELRSAKAEELDSPAKSLSEVRKELKI